LIVPGPGGCWLWTGTPNSKGYGRWWVRGPDRGRLAHVVVWETFNGPTPEGMQHDHLCRVKPCVNEAHLELVTGRVNLHRRNLANGWGRAENRVPDQAF
ncbi:MAG: HNH endonuclease signature motif containing protein, partial [Actinomycetota bacterium]